MALSEDMKDIPLNITYITTGGAQRDIQRIAAEVDQLNSKLDAVGENLDDPDSVLQLLRVEVEAMKKDIEELYGGFNYLAKIVQKLHPEAGIQIKE